MDQLSLLAKYWEPGAVKTRLAKSVGPARAADFHRLCVNTLSARFGDVGDCRTVVYAPADRREAFAALAGSRWEFEPQAEGDLGRRMREHLERSFRSGARRVVLIGADSPNVPRCFVRKAFEMLSDYPVVIGPAEDGGYYLVGLRGELPPIFEGMEWGTSSVLRETERRLEREGWRYGLLPYWHDVDEAPNLIRLQKELAEKVEAGEYEELRKMVDELTSRLV